MLNRLPILNANFDDKLDVDAIAQGAEKLATTRTITIGGEATAFGNFDGTSDLDLLLVLANSGVLAGTYPKVTVDSKGRVISGSILAPTDIPNLDASKVLTGVFASARIPILNQNTTGSAGRLTVARTLSLVGDVNGFMTFDGSADASAQITLSDTGVGEGSYGGSTEIPVVTVDTKGRVTSLTTAALLAASTVQVGVVQLNSTTNSTSTTQAATPSAVKTAYDLANAAIPASQKGIANGVATLDGAGLIPANQLPSFVDDVIEVADYASLPVSGSAGKIYLTLDSNDIYRWSGTVYVQISNNVGMADVATRLATPRTINGVAFDGTANITIFDNSKVPLSGTGATGTWDIGITGNAVTATRLATARTISINGDIAGSASFDGTTNITIGASLPNTGVVAGTYNDADTTAQPFTVDSKGRVTGVGLPITIRPAWGSITNTPTTLAGYGIQDALTLTSAAALAAGVPSSGIASTAARADHVHPVQTNIGGNAETATKLATARSISISGDGTGTILFDGTANVTINMSLANNGVVAGTYPKVVVDSKGRVTAGTNLLVADIPGLDAGKIITGVFSPGLIPTLNQNTTGTAATATKLATARNINSVLFDGTADIMVYDATKEPVIGVGGLDQYWRGDKTWQDLPVSTRATLLTGLSTASATAVVSTDTLLVGVGKLQAQVDLKAPLSSPAFTGTPTVPTAAPGTNTVQVASTAFVQAEIASRSPTKTGGGATGIWSIDIAGEAATTTKLATARNITISGDGTGAVSFDGSSDAAIVLTLADTGVTAETYGSNVQVPVLTIDGKGRVVFAEAASIRSGTTTQTGIVQLNSSTSSTSTTQAATPSAVKTAYDLALAANVSASAAIPAALLGAANGVATLDSNGFIPTSQLPSFVDDVIEVADYASLPGTGVSGKLYITLDTNGVYRWSGTVYVQISDSVSTSDTATRLSTARNIGLIGDATGSTNFDGSANVTITVALSDTGVVAGTYSKVTVDTKGRVTDGATLIAADIPVLDASKITTGVFSSSRIPVLNQSTTGSAAKWTTARTLSLNGDATGSVSFDGSSNASITVVFADTGVVAGTYSKVTVDGKGRVTDGDVLVASDIPDLDADKIVTGTLDDARIPTNQTGKNFSSDSGFGTTDPHEAVDVAGNVRVREENAVKFGGTGAADASFEIKYNATTKSLDFNFTE